MKRRQLLAVAGSTAVAGCTGDKVADSNESGAGGGGEVLPEPTTEREPAVDVSISSVNLETRTTASGLSETAVTGLVENTGDARLGAVTATGKFYNADGQLITSGIWDVRDLATGEVWEPWIRYTGDQDVTSVDLSVTDVFEHQRSVNPDGMVLESHDIEIPTDDLAMPYVSGTVSNQTGTGVPTLLARPKLYAENGHLLETGITTVQNFGAGETWSFDQRIHFANGSWTDRIDSYQVVLTV